MPTIFGSTTPALSMRANRSGSTGPEAEGRGYDAASWWARGSLGYSAIQTSGAKSQAEMVGHGDTIWGPVLAGGICKALVERPNEPEKGLLWMDRF